MSSNKKRHIDDKSADTVSLQIIPDELLSSIFDFLSLEESVKVLCSFKRWKTLIMNPAISQPTPLIFTRDPAQVKQSYSLILQSPLRNRIGTFNGSFNFAWNSASPTFLDPDLLLLLFPYLSSTKGQTIRSGLLRGLHLSDFLTPPWTIRGLSFNDWLNATSRLFWSQHLHTLCVEMDNLRGAQELLQLVSRVQTISEFGLILRDTRIWDTVRGEFSQLNFSPLNALPLLATLRLDCRVIGCTSDQQPMFSAAHIDQIRSLASLTFLDTFGGEWDRHRLHELCREPRPLLHQITLEPPTSVLLKEIALLPQLRTFAPSSFPLEADSLPTLSAAAGFPMLSSLRLRNLHWSHRINFSRPHVLESAAVGLALHRLPTTLTALTLSNFTFTSEQFTAFVAHGLPNLTELNLLIGVITPNLIELTKLPKLRVLKIRQVEIFNQLVHLSILSSLKEVHLMVRLANFPAMISLAVLQSTLPAVDFYFNP